MRNDNVVEKNEKKSEYELNFTWNSHVYHWHIYVYVHMIFGRNDTEMFKVFDISMEMKSWFIAVDSSAYAI